MSIDQDDNNGGAVTGVGRPGARAGDAEARAAARLRVMIADALAPETARLDDRARVLVRARLKGLVDLIERDLRQHAARQLVARKMPELALPLAGDDMMVFARLNAAGLLADPMLMRVLIGQCAEAVLAEHLPVPENGGAALALQLSRHDDGVIARAAQAMLAAEARRKGAGEGQVARGELPAEVQHRLVWRAAAVLRATHDPANGPARDAIDRALVEAAERALAAHDEGERLEATAMRLAAAIEARPEELPDALERALGESRPALFTALLAHALRIDYETVRWMLTDPADTRLWTALRSVRVERAGVARIGLALADADPRRDLEVFAEQIDSIAAITPEAAQQLLGDLRMHPDLGVALAELARAR